MPQVTGYRVPLYAPIGEVLHNRFNNDPRKPSPADEGFLDYGPAPIQIPRIWANALRFMAGPKQWAFEQRQDGYRGFYLPHIPTLTSGRSKENVSAAFGPVTTQFNDTSHVPALFVGWNPANALRK